LKFNGIGLLLPLFLILCGVRPAPAEPALCENIAPQSHRDIFAGRPGFFIAFYATEAESLETPPDSAAPQEKLKRGTEKSSPLIPSLETSSSLETPLLGKSPTGALLRSLALPGWGQIYTRSYIRGAIYGVGEVIFIGAICNFWRLTDEHQERFEFAREYNRGDFVHTSGVTILPHSSQFQLPEIPQEQEEFDLYQRFQDKRNFYLWITATWVFVSMFDAYAGAHLYNFDRLSEEQLAIDFRIEDQDNEKTCKLTITKSF